MANNDNTLNQSIPLGKSFNGVTGLQIPKDSTRSFNGASNLQPQQAADATPPVDASTTTTSSSTSQTQDENKK